MIVEAAAPPERLLTFRPMFGAVMASAGGKTFASLSKAGLALRLDEAARQELLQIEGAKPLQYAPNCPAGKSYVTVPEPMFDDIEQLSVWIARAADFVQSQALKAKRRKS